MSDAIKAIGRRDSGVVQRILLKRKMAEYPWRNIRALAFAARHLEGNHSPSQQIIEDDKDCPAIVKSTIAQMRAG